MEPDYSNYSARDAFMAIDDIDIDSIRKSTQENELVGIKRNVDILSRRIHQNQGSLTPDEQRTAKFKVIRINEVYTKRFEELRNSKNLLQPEPSHTSSSTVNPVSKVNPTEIMQKVLLTKSKNGESGFGEIKYELEQLRNIISQCPDHEKFFGLSEMTAAMARMNIILNKKEFAIVDLQEIVSALTYLKNAEQKFALFAEEASPKQQVTFNFAGEKETMSLSDWKNAFFEATLKKIDHRIDDIIQAAGFSSPSEAVKGVLLAKDKDGRTDIAILKSDLQQIKSDIYQCREGSAYKGFRSMDSFMNEVEELAERIANSDLKDISVQDVFSLISKLNLLKKFENHFATYAVERNKNQIIHSKIAEGLHGGEDIIANLSLAEWKTSILDSVLARIDNRVARLNTAMGIQ